MLIGVGSSGLTAQGCGQLMEGGSSAEFKYVNEGQRSRQVVISSSRLLCIVHDCFNKVLGRLGWSEGSWFRIRFLGDFSGF